MPSARTTREVLHFLVHQRLNVEWLDDVTDELRVHVAIADLLVKEVAHSAIKARGDFLRLVADIERVHLYTLVVWLDQASKQADKGRLASAIFTEHDHNLAVSEFSRIDLRGRDWGTLLLDNTTRV